MSLNNWGLNFLQNEFSQSSQIYLSQEKLRKMFTFSILKWLFAELSKMTTIFTQNSPWMSFEWKVVSFCEFAQLCKQLFLSKLEKNHVTQLTGFSSQNTKWGPYCPNKYTVLQRSDLVMLHVHIVFDLTLLLPWQPIMHSLVRHHSSFFTKCLEYYVPDIPTFTKNWPCIHDKMGKENITILQDLKLGTCGCES